MIFQFQEIKAEIKTYRICFFVSVYLYMQCINISSVDPCLINTSKILHPPPATNKSKNI